MRITSNIFLFSIPTEIAPNLLLSLIFSGPSLSHLTLKNAFSSHWMKKIPSWLYPTFSSSVCINTFSFSPHFFAKAIWSSIYLIPSQLQHLMFLLSKICNLLFSFFLSVNQELTRSETVLLKLTKNHYKVDNIYGHSPKRDDSQWKILGPFCAGCDNAVEKVASNHYVGLIPNCGVY